MIRRLTLPPLVPAIMTSDTFPRRRKSNIVTPTTPICIGQPLHLILTSSLSCRSLTIQ